MRLPVARRVYTTLISSVVSMYVTPSRVMIMVLRTMEKVTTSSLTVFVVTRPKIEPASERY